MIDKIALILMILGALNWACVGLFGVDLIAYGFGGQAAAASRVLYTLFGVAGLWSISLLFRERRPEEI